MQPLTMLFEITRDRLGESRREASMHFQKLTECNERLKRLQARHKKQNKIVAAAKAVLDTWDADGELGDAIAALRKALCGGRP